MKILITGGAGFIGSSLGKQLLLQGHTVTIYDNFCEQIHGKCPDKSQFEKMGFEIIEGDITDRNLLWESLREKELVVHFAAMTGTGQSMYNVTNYNHINVCGTANICDFLYQKDSKIQKIIVASSRSIYGEGKYQCTNCGIVYPFSREVEDIRSGNYNPKCPVCKNHSTMTTLATDENSFPRPSSIYASTKLTQENQIDITARAIGIPSFCFRFQNVYGPGQSLINPYTGILAIFLRLALQNKTIEIFEDGSESRDFVYIDDVVDAVILGVNSIKSGNYILNVGSGVSTSVIEVATLIKKYVESTSEIKISNAFRNGDIRHNFSDNSRIENILRFSPKWLFKEGLINFIKWSLNSSQLLVENDFDNSIKELVERNLYSK